MFTITNVIEKVFAELIKNPNNSNINKVINDHYKKELFVIYGILTVIFAFLALNFEANPQTSTIAILFIVVLAALVFFTIMRLSVKKRVIQMAELAKKYSTKSIKELANDTNTLSTQYLFYFMFVETATFDDETINLKSGDTVNYGLLRQEVLKGYKPNSSKFFDYKSNTFKQYLELSEHAIQKSPKNDQPLVEILKPHFYK